MSDSTAKRRVAVFTADKYLYQKIRLELYGAAETVLCPADTGEVFDLVLVDKDGEYADRSGIYMTRRGAFKNEVALPFPFGGVCALLTDTERAMQLSAEDSTVTLSGKRIKLTEVEFKLLSILLEKEGGYTAREELLSRVWNGEADGGVINVYIHYLREKLETEGEKIILCSRKYGYSISEKYAGGRKND